MQNIFVLHRRSTTAAAGFIARVRPTDLALPTPCAGWDLRALLEHMAGQDHGFAAAVRAGSDGDTDAGAFAPRPLGPDPVATLSAAAADVDAAFEAVVDDGAEAGRSVWLAEFGHRFPVEVVAGFHLLDVLVHGWDVAATLGVAVDYDDDLVAACLDQAKRVPAGTARERPGAAFAPVRPAGGTDPWDRTLTLLGRSPMWTPGT